MHSGKLIKQLREAANLTQKELGEILDCSKAAISQLESREDCKLSTIAHVAKACGYNVEISLKLREPKETDITITI